MAMNAAFSLLLLLSTASIQAQVQWNPFAPPDGGFTVLLPGTPEKNASGQYTADVGPTVFIVQADPIDPGVHLIVVGGDQKKIKAMLETVRDMTLNEIKGTVQDSKIADVDGHPSMMFSFAMQADGLPFLGTERVVLTDDRMYVLVAMAPKNAQDDAKRFHESFKLVAAAPVDAKTAAPLRTISFSDAVCGKIPPLPIAFEMPADFEARAVGGVEGGCLWGVKGDLDRVTVNPDEGDFTSLRRGVFRLRVTSNVVFNKVAGVFDQMDGTGETGLRRTLSGTGAKVITWKKDTIAGLPALQIVADAFGSRLYMLYLGNTQFISNVMLVNYYHPAKRSAADEALWTAFVAGIKPKK
jgi:hypothetical protein